MSRKCNGCSKELVDGEKVTVVIPDVEVVGRYRKNTDYLHLKLSGESIDSRVTLLYCIKCLNIGNHIQSEGS